MAIALEDKPNVVAPGGDYPYGRIKDDTGVGDGTPVNTAVYGDFHQFFAKLLDDAGMTANGHPENSSDGFQYNEALMKLMAGDWVEVGSGGGAPAYESDWIPYTDGGRYRPLSFRLEGRCVRLSGGAQYLSSGSSTIFYLPPQLRPNTEIRSVVLAVDVPEYVEISQNGEVWVLNPNSISIYIFNLTFPLG